jgi:hypothetical protein
VITPRAIDDPLAEMSECFSFGDSADALTMADLSLAGQPDNVFVQESRNTCLAAQHRDPPRTQRLAPMSVLLAGDG